MSMEINGIYNSSASRSTYTTAGGRQTADKTAAEETAQTGAAARKTAAEELEYLSGKFSGYNFLAGVYKQGTTFGSANTTNIMIDPRFLEKMANDPELEAEYEKQIAMCKELDQQLKSMEAARGWRCECGTIIDKDGGMSGWAIVTKDPNAKSELQKMSEKADKIREQNEAKKQEKEKLEEKRKVSREEKAELKKKAEKAGKEKFGDKFRGVTIIEKDGRKDKAVGKEDGKKNEKEDRDSKENIGVNLDIRA